MIGSTFPSLPTRQTGWGTGSKFFGVAGHAAGKGNFVAVEVIVLPADSGFAK